MSRTCLGIALSSTLYDIVVLCILSNNDYLIIFEVSSYILLEYSEKQKKTEKDYNISTITRHWLDVLVRLLDVNSIITQISVVINEFPMGNKPSRWYYGSIAIIFFKFFYINILLEDPCDGMHFLEGSCDKML